jgi:signal transduction histidine kinase/ligand-binding sensor domain-containing protein
MDVSFWGSRLHMQRRPRPLRLATRWTSLRFIAAAALSVLAASTSPAAALDPQKALTQYGLDNYRTAQGLPQNSVLALAQTADGYLWLATYEGLVRFDGARFTVFDKQNTPAMSASWVTALLEGSRGALWVGTVDGLLQWKDGELTRGGLPAESVTALVEDTDGSLWVGTAGAGLVQYKDGQVTRVTAEDGLSGSIITALFVDKRGDLWVGTSDGGLSRRSGDSGGKFARDAGGAGFPDAPVLRVFEAADGALWFGTRGKGMVEKSGGALRVYDGKDGLPSDVVNDFFVDRDGNFFIGTSKGVARLKGGAFALLPPPRGLTAHDARALLEDAEGSVWIGSEIGGLTRLRDGDFTTYSSEEGLSHDIVRSIVEDSAGSVWIATEGGGLTEIAGGAFKTYSTKDGLAGDVVWGLFEDSQRALWIGTLGDGISRKVGPGITSITKKDGLPVDLVTSFAEHDGALWLGSDGLVQYKDGVFTVWGSERGMPKTRVNALFEDRSGVLWICTLAYGLGRMEGGALSFLTPKDGLAGNNAVSVTEDADGALWVATSGGLSRVKDGVVRSFTIKAGLYDGAIHQVLDDGEGRLWMSTNKGIFHIRKDDIRAFEEGRLRSIPERAYGAADGMKNAECNGGTHPAGFKSRDGRLWFATLEGVAVVDPKRLRRNPRPPPVYIERLAVDGADVAGVADPSAPRELPPGSRDVSIHYTALSLLDPSKVNFKYMLEGYDRGYNDAGTRRSAYYTNLRPGSYRFRVIASNNDGVWNEAGASITFHIKPYFYQTTAFAALCALFGLLGAGGAYGARVSYLKRRERELMEHNAALAAALAQAREAARLKGEFVANVSHELRTPLNAIVNVPDGLLNFFAEREIAVCSACYGRFEIEPGESIEGGAPCPGCGAEGTLSTARAQLFTGDGDVAVKNLRILKRSGANLLSLIDDVLDFSKLDAGEMARGRGEVLVSELFDDLAATLAPLAEPRRICLAIHAPPEGLAVDADLVKCRQIFVNVIGNAIKFSPDASVIDVSVAAEGSSAVFRVEDRGIGVAPEHHAMIFESFQQVDGGNTRRAGGTGLGLAITKQLVELHGGAIWLESALGEGSIFFIRLPLAPGTEEKESETAEEMEPAGPFRVQ